MTVDIDVDIRPSTDSDAASMARLAQPYSNQTELQALLTAATVIARDGLSLIAEVDGKVAGHLLVSPEDTERAILAIAVDPEFQGRGVGKRLMDEAIGWARGRFSEIALTVDPDNVAAMRLYASSGFALHGINQGNALSMVRRLR